jgi:predicted TIM-barrel fold metal-dependent hydrolase
VIIDVHAHYYPARYLELVGAGGPPAAVAVLASQSTEERLALLDETGIDVQVVSPGRAQPYLPVAARATEAARVGNDLYAELCADHPGRFLMFAGLPLPHRDEALAEIDRVAAWPSVVGYSLGCSVGDRQLDDPALDPVWAELDQRGATVFLHPVGQGGTPWLAGHNLSWLVGAPFEDTAAALRLILAGVPDRYPSVRVIVPHLGGTIPFLLSRVTRKSAAQVLRGLRSMYYDTASGGSVEGLTRACEVYGADRVLFGTDYPYCNEPEFRGQLSYLSEAGLSPADLAGVQGDSAAALLGVRVASEG